MCACDERVQAVAFCKLARGLNSTAHTHQGPDSAKETCCNCHAVNAAAAPAVFHRSSAGALQAPQGLPHHPQELQTRCHAGARDPAACKAPNLYNWQICIRANLAACGKQNLVYPAFPSSRAM